MRAWDSRRGRQPHVHTLLRGPTLNYRTTESEEDLEFLMRDPEEKP